MADYVPIQALNTEGNPLAAPIIEVLGDEFQVLEVPAPDGKKYAIPVIVVDTQGSVMRSYAATTSSYSSTNPKILDGLPEGYAPKAGEMISVKFINYNNAANLSFKIGESVYPVKFNGSNTNTTTAGYGTGAVVFFVYDGESFNQIGSQRNSDSNDSAHAIYSQAHYQAGADRIYYCNLVGEGTDGLYYPLALGNTTESDKTIQTKPFKMNGKLFLYASSIQVAPNGVFTSNSAFLSVGYNDTTRYNYAFNGSSHLQARSPLYLVGRLSNGGFVLDNSSATSWYTTELPSSPDGRLYREIGVFGGGGNFDVGIKHNMKYWYHDGAKIAEYIERDTALPLIVSGTTNSENVAVKEVEGIPPYYRPKHGDFLALTFNASSSATQPKVSFNGDEYFLKWNGKVITSTAIYNFGANQTILVRFQENDDEGWYEFFYNPDWVDTDTLSTLRAGFASGQYFGKYGEKFSGYQLLFEGSDGRFYPLFPGTASAGSRTKTTAALKINGTIWYHASTSIREANANIDYAVRLADTVSSTLAAYMHNNMLTDEHDFRTIYLKGVPSANGTFTVHEDIFVTYDEIPSSPDGNIYIELMRQGDITNRFHIPPAHPVFAARGKLYV